MERCTTLGVWPTRADGGLVANMNGSTGAGCWTTGPGSSPEMEPPSYDLTATERALRRERIRRTADVAGRVVSPTMLDIITDMGSYPRQWASIDLAIAADRAAHACWHGTWEQAEAWLDVFAWALAGLLNMHRDAIATDITVVKGEAHGDIVMRDQRVMIVTAELSIGVLTVRIGYGGDSAALDGIVSWSSSDRGIVAVMADVVRWVDELIPALVSGS